MEEAGRCWASIRTTANILTLVAELLSAAGSAEQKERFLRPLLAGERMGWFAITEPGAGSDAAALTTRAERLPGGSYRLTSHKATSPTPATETRSGALATVGPQPQHQGGHGIPHLAHRNRRIPEPEQATAARVRAVGCCDVVLDGAVVPAANVLGEVGAAACRSPCRAVNGGRLRRQRRVHGHRPGGPGGGERPRGRAHPVRRAAGGLPARAAAHRGHRGADQRGPPGLPVGGPATGRRAGDDAESTRLACSMSKYFCSEAANQVATKAVQVFGAAGLMEGNVAERLFRDAREATIPEELQDACCRSARRCSACRRCGER